MQTHEIPRDYRGEGRILYIFSTKALIYTSVGAAIGLIFFFISKMFDAGMIGLIITVFFGLIGFSIGTFKVPESKTFEFTKKTGGEKIDDIIIRWIKFKKNKNKVYVYTEEIDKEETKDEQ